MIADNFCVCVSINKQLFLFKTFLVSFNHILCTILPQLFTITEIHIIKSVFIVIVERCLVICFGMFKIVCAVACALMFVRENNNGLFIRVEAKHTTALLIRLVNGLSI